MSVRMIKNQVGDTIIEVMLAVVVVGMVLGASYATATRALRTGRFAQEQTEALKQAESQIEKLKYISTLGSSASSTQNIFDSAPGQVNFCIDDSFNKVVQVPGSPTGYCALRSGLYDVLVTYTALTPAPDSVQDQFKVVVTWDRVGSDQKGNVSIAYKLHKQ